MPLIWIAIAAALLLIETQVSHTLYPVNPEYPVNPDGSFETTGPGVTGSLGIAVYVAWVGVALMAVATRFLHDSARRNKAEEA